MPTPYSQRGPAVLLPSLVVNAQLPLTSVASSPLPSEHLSLLPTALAVSLATVETRFIRKLDDEAMVGGRQVHVVGGKRNPEKDRALFNLEFDQLQIGEYGLIFWSLD